MTAYTSTQRVRRLTGATTTDSDYVSDNDVADILLVYPNVYKAAAEVCRQRAMYWTNAVNDNQAGNAHARWLALADKYDAKAATDGSNVASGGGIYVGGASIADNDTLDDDTDLVQPRFRIDGDSADGQYDDDEWDR
ncbi:MAG: hypothetical protein WC642_11180 [Nocardioides sp.]|jgi:hypothetical protein